MEEEGIKEQLNPNRTAEETTESTATDEIRETVTKKKRRIYSPQEKMKIYEIIINSYGRNRKRLVDIQEDLAKESFMLAISQVAEYMEKAYDFMFNTAEAKKIVIERYSKKKFIEDLMLRYVIDTIKDKDVENRDKISAIAALSRISRETDDFLSRIDKLGGVAVKQDVRISEKMDVEEVAKRLAQEEADKLGVKLQTVKEE